MSIFLEELRLNPQSFLIANSVLNIYGPDAEAYLHSQTTNNVLNLADGEFQFNAILDISGKIISAFILCKKNKSEFYIFIDNKYLERTYLIFFEI